MNLDLLNWLGTRLEPNLDALRRLVEQNSFTANAPGIDLQGRMTAQLFADLGFTAEFLPSEHPGYGHHLFLSRPGTSHSRPVVLVSHLDTVYPPEEEQAQNFRWEPAPEESRIYGPGTVDIKGGTTLLLLTLEGLRQFAPDVFESHTWLLAFDASEEVMSHDFADRTAERCPSGATAVLVFEGGPLVNGTWQIVSSRKGRELFRISARGRAAHAGSAHADGINAIVSLAAAIQQAAQLTDHAAELTVNVGCIEGGTVVNRVPHEAWAELEVRAYDPALLDRVAAALRDLERPMAPPHQAEIRVTSLGRSPAWPTSPANAALAGHWVQAAKALGLTLVPGPRGGLSDANYLCHLGPTLDGLGPSGGNAHCSERSADRTKLPEYVEPGTFVPKAAVNILALLQLLSESSNGIPKNSDLPHD
jgi:glutamate carboxypeptidase